MLWGMTNARSEFEQHLSTIQQYTALRLSEADTRSHLIDPLLRILGFSDVRQMRMFGPAGNPYARNICEVISRSR